MRRIALASLMVCVLAAPCGVSVARVTEIDVRNVEPFAGGAAFGTAGAYERVKGTFKGVINEINCSRIG